MQKIISSSNFVSSHAIMTSPPSFFLLCSLFQLVKVICNIRIIVFLYIWLWVNMNIQYFLRVVGVASFAYSQISKCYSTNVCYCAEMNMVSIGDCERRYSHWLMIEHKCTLGALNLIKVEHHNFIWANNATLLNTVVYVNEHKYIIVPKHILWVRPAFLYLYWLLFKIKVYSMATLFVNELKHINDKYLNKEESQ